MIHNNPRHQSCILGYLPHHHKTHHQSKNHMNNLEFRKKYCFYFCIKGKIFVKLTQGVVTNLKSRISSIEICFKMKPYLMAWGDDLVRWEWISTKFAYLVRWLRSTIIDCEWIPARISSKVSLTNLKFFNNVANVIYLQIRLSILGSTSKWMIIISTTSPWDLWMSQVQSMLL